MIFVPTVDEFAFRAAMCFPGWPPYWKPLGAAKAADVTASTLYAVFMMSLSVD